MADAEISQTLDRALDELPYPAAENAADQLAELAELVEAWGARMNLTGHRSATAIAEALIGDAIGLLGEMEKLEGAVLEGRLVDLGSGAGFPGLPIAMLRPRVDVHMVEAREKRHFFQRAACRQLGLANAHPIHDRIENHPVGDADWVVAQAVGPIEKVIEAMRPYARESAHLLVPGSDRLAQSAGPESLGGRVISYRSPIRNQARKLWVGVVPSA